MAEITITHTRAEGTILTGSSKGDGIFEIVREYGFWFSRSIEGLFIKRSRDKAADTWRINRAAEALRAAGHTVTVEINERVRRSFSEAEADREERAEGRAECYGDRAGRAAASSDARRGVAENISRRFEFGQPILVGHHSERRARRDQERIHTNMRKSIEDGERSAYWADRARAAANYEAFRKDPYRTLRRLKKLRADLRQQERYVTEAAEKGWDGERHEVNVLDLREEIQHWEAIVEKAKADGVKIWGPDDFAPGDYVRYLGSWYQVKRVNPTTLSVAWNLRLAPKQVMTLEDATDRGRVWTHPADYTEVRARCPEAAMDAFLAEGKVPGTKLADEASEAQSASAVREAQAAKPKAAKRSDPKVAKRVFVTCDLGGEVAELVWLNGNSRPHKDFTPELIKPPEGERFHRAVWSKSLQAEITRLLAKRGYVCGEEDWAVSRDRSGFVRDVVLAPAAPEPPQAEEPAAVVDEQPAAEPAIEEPPAGEAEAPAGEAPEAHGESPEESGKTALTCDFSGNTRNHAGRTRVGNSEDPLTHPTQEDAMTAPIGTRLTRKERKAAQMAEMRERAAQRPDVERTPELDAAYRAYVDEGIAMADGYYAPLDFQAWAHTLGSVEVAAAATEKAAAADVETPVDELSAEPPAEEPAAAEAEAPTEEQPTEPEESAGEVPEGNGETPEGSEKTALTCDLSGNTRNHTGRTRVGISEDPLNHPTQEVPTMTATTTRAPKTAKAAKAEKVTAAPQVKTVQKVVPIDRIDRDPSQPRKVFDQAKLEELAGSIKELGLLQPVSLRYIPSTKRYVLIAGERRWRASKLAGLTEMPAVVNHGIEDGSRETLARQVAENVGRADMTPIEEAESFQRLVEANYTIDEVAKMVGKSAAYVGWRIDLLRLCEPAREALGKGHLPVGLSWYVSLLNCDNQMRFLTRYARGEFKSTRDAEAFAQAARAEEKRQEEQGSFFVLADEVAGGKDGQDAIPGSLDLPESERERIVSDRNALVKKIDRLSQAGEILSELASADPEQLALLLAGTPGGVPGHQMRIEHLRELTLRAHKNLRQAQAIAAVRASSIEINPEAAASSVA
ncbi:ParB/RepB/Spo0J family partition protein [Streptomyces sp. NPDC091412]|uniref:ParB/RepB/Spo0J family partition protein n=1 Tax=Streptomyces sp. NPDC091412 TaxID=3366002 RepID=UPI003809E4CB